MKPKIEIIGGGNVGTALKRGLEGVIQLDYTLNMDTDIGFRLVH